jgi:hypothetical protein
MFAYTPILHGCPIHVEMKLNELKRIDLNELYYVTLAFWSTLNLMRLFLGEYIEAVDVRKQNLSAE